MLDGLLWEQWFRPPLDTGLERWSYEVIEEERAIDQERKTEDLKPLECLPSQA